MSEAAIAKKETLVQAAAEKFESAASVVIVDYRGLTVEEVTNLRKQLRDAGVEVTQVRFQGMIHDFVMVNSLDHTNATRAAMVLSTEWVNGKNNL